MQPKVKLALTKVKVAICVRAILHSLTNKFQKTPLRLQDWSSILDHL